MFTLFDYIAIAIIVLSALMGVWRGFLAEVFALVGWIAACVIAGHFAHALAVYLPADWPGGTLTQFVLAFVLIVVAVIVGAGVLGLLLRRFTELTGLKPIDRSLGLLFGVARGVLLVLLIVAFAGLTELPHYPFWQNALFRPYAQRGVQMLKPLLPAALAAYIKI